MPWQTYAPPWSPAEDTALRLAVQQHGTAKASWQLVADAVGNGRSWFSCKHRYYALPDYETARRSTQKMRACLGPGCAELPASARMFESTGPGNRICPDCTESHAYKSAEGSVEPLFDNEHGTEELIKLTTSGYGYNAESRTYLKKHGDKAVQR